MAELALLLQIAWAKKCVPSLTSMSKNQTKETGGNKAKRVQEVAKYREFLTPPRKKVREEVEEKVKWNPEGTSNEVSAVAEGKCKCQLRSRRKESNFP